MYADILQQVALVILVILLLITISIDYFYGRHLLNPLQDIIRFRLTEQTFPFSLKFKSIKTSTSDFRLLDERLCELMTRATKAYVREKEFTSNASHELLTPISILRGKIENLLNQDIPLLEAQDKLLSSLQTLERLNGIVRTLLLLARVDSGQYERNETVLVGQLLQEICEELRPLMDDKEIKVKFELPDALYIYNQHRQLLFQLFYNLINNAIQYNRQSGWIKIIGSESAEKYIIDISDSGMGMTSEQIAKIFDRFQTKQSTGHGLGLSIVKSIADFLDIEIQISASNKYGTTIRLSFEKS
jgi:signal transduction histidine kinase